MAISFLQGKGSEASGEALDIAFTSNVTAGSLLICGVMMNPGETVSVSDAKNGSWAELATTVSSPFPTRFFYVLGAVAGATTVDISTTSSTSIFGVIGEYSGVATTSALDQQHSNGGSSQSSFTDSVTPGSNNEVLIGIYVQNVPQTITGTGGTAARVNSGSGVNYLWLVDNIITNGAGVSQSITGTMASATWGDILASFLPLPSTFSISGNAGVANALVSYTGTSSGSVTASETGAYTISGLVNGSYTVTPSLAGYTFSPTSANETVSGSNITGVNFTGTFGAGGFSSDFSFAF
jgi:hypothetical protein